MRRLIQPAILIEIARLIGIRNRVMYPTRRHRIADEGFEFACDMHRRLHPEALRRPGSERQIQPVPIA